jgi:signal transduction histidine kinase
MRWPLRNQIIGPLLAVAVVSLAAVGAIYSWLAANQTRSRIETQLRGVVGVLVSANFPLTESVLKKMRDLSSAEFALSDKTGRVLASTILDDLGSLRPDTALTRAEDVALGAPVTLTGRDYFHTAVRLADRAGDAQPRVLHVLFPGDEYRRSWRQAFLPPLLVGLMAIAAAVVAARLLAGRISRATARLGDEVQRLARGDFRAAALPAIDDEIRDLTQAVNRTAAMLADYERQVRRTEQVRTVAQLGASLAHEMRNAATGCRMAVDLHAEACRCGNDPESLVVARRQLQLMESQLQRFLQVGRTTDKMTLRPVDLARVIGDLLPLVRPTANHAHVELAWRCPDDPLIVDGDGDALGQMALNLILNAVEAVQQGPRPGAAAGRVAVELRSLGAENAELSVTDTGPGPPESTAATLFEPFVTSKAEGAGLGLAVARQVVEAHGGSIGWRRLDGLTQFRIVLPLAAKEVSCV